MTTADQKYRADVSQCQPDGAVVWSAAMAGQPVHFAKVNNCRLVNMAGGMRRTVFATGEADLPYFSTPAVCYVMKCRVRGYLTDDGEGNLVFHHVYY